MLLISGTCWGSWQGTDGGGKTRHLALTIGYQPSSIPPQSPSSYPQTPAAIGAELNAFIYEQSSAGYSSISGEVRRTRWWSCLLISSSSRDHHARAAGRQDCCCCCCRQWWCGRRSREREMLKRATSQRYRVNSYVQTLTNGCCHLEAACRLPSHLLPGPPPARLGPFWVPAAGPAATAGNWHC